MNTENITPAVGASIHDLVQHIVNEWNRLERQATDAFNAEHPNQEPEEPELCTFDEAVKAFAADNPYGPHQVEIVVREIKDAVLKAVNTVTPIDPWPGLTRKELKFLVGGRRHPRGSTFYRSVNSYHHEDEPLTLIEKFAAAEHRAWLEAGADKRRTKLAKAKAIVAAMEGSAA